MMTTKLYQIDTYLKEWDARILAAKPAPEVPGDSAKQPAGGSAEASPQTCYLIQLDQTAFFPEGAGRVQSRGDPGELTGFTGRCIFRRGRTGRRRSDLAHGMPAGSCRRQQRADRRALHHSVRRLQSPLHS